MLLCRCLTFEHYYKDACGLLDHWERLGGTIRPPTPSSKPESETIDSAISRGALLSFVNLISCSSSHIHSHPCIRYQLITFCVVTVHEVFGVVILAVFPVRDFSFLVTI